MALELCEYLHNYLNEFLIPKHWRQSEICEHKQISSWCYKYTEIISNDFKIQEFHQPCIPSGIYSQYYTKIVATNP